MMIIPAILFALVGAYFGLMSVLFPLMSACARDTLSLSYRLTNTLAVLVPLLVWGSALDSSGPISGTALVAGALPPALAVLTYVGAFAAARHFTARQSSHI